MNPRSRTLPSAAFIILFLSLFSSCDSQTIWNQPLPRLRENLRESRYDSLASLDFSRDDPAEAFRLGGEAPYFLSFILFDLGKGEESETMLELLIERGHPIVSHPKFRRLLDRDGNLLANQVIREANGNIAYRSVDIDIDDLSDEDFWNIIDETPYNELIENNAAIAIVKMAEKLDIIEQE